ncbi:MAG TPA: hypothetical protein VGF94_03825 [Kofleriaceae bacterium]
MRWAWLCLAVACSGGTPSDHGDARGDAPPGCGDGVIAGDEQCDGTDLGGATCASAVAPGWLGTLGCTSACAFDVAACNTPQTTYTAGFTTSANWEAFDVAAVSASAVGFASSVFDGRYLYLVPGNGSVIARYDSNAMFTDGGSWTVFDLAAVTTNATNFQGGAFDGKYIYLVPYGGGVSGVALRYDPTNANGFASAQSWTAFDLTTVNANAKGFVRAVFDGRYIYYVPYYNGAYHGTTARYDTRGGFGDPTSWQVFDLSTVNPAAMGYFGGEFDGRYVYYVPYYNGAYNGTVMRLDTHAPSGFADASSWTAFDTTTVFADDVGFEGAAFDGRYLYMPQGADQLGYGQYVARYDTQAPFGAAASWTQYAPTSLCGYNGAVFDGRYVEFSCFSDGQSYVGTTVAYDTQGGGFANPAAWSLFDASGLNTSAKGMDGAAFDGANVYFVPYFNGVYQGVVTRYHAKTPSWEPRGWNSTFE